MKYQTIIEAKSAKQKLENDICQLISDFNVNFGCVVESVSLDFITGSSKESDNESLKLQKVRTSVKL